MRALGALVLFNPVVDLGAFSRPSRTYSAKTRV